MIYKKFKWNIKHMENKSPAGIDIYGDVAGIIVTSGDSGPDTSAWNNQGTVGILRGLTLSVRSLPESVVGFELTGSWGRWGP